MKSVLIAAVILFLAGCAKEIHEASLQPGIATAVAG
jgi:uncharacterized lipoprotein YajG